MKKKAYKKPVVKKVEFDYRNQVVAASGCEFVWARSGETVCTTGDPYKIYTTFSS